MLKVSTQFEANKMQGMEAPGLVIHDVIKLERKAMKKKLGYASQQAAQPHLQPHRSDVTAIPHLHTFTSFLQVHRALYVPTD